MIKHSIANAVLDEALRSGGDFSELYMQDTETNSLSMVNVSLRTQNISVRQVQAFVCSRVPAAHMPIQQTQVKKR